jgi:uncharacterized protein (DUF4213/DUF364 family)
VGKARATRSGWALYEELLAQVPPDVRVRACLVGRSWTLVETQAQAVGMAMTIDEGCTASRLRPPLAGRPLRELATYLTSWNLAEASLGLAALNAHVNSRAQLRAWLAEEPGESPNAMAFAAMEEELAGKKVAVIGHFPDMDRLRERCQLTVFERRPRDGDVPDYAEDFLLPQQDYVFITGTALTNKTLPHLLDLCRDAFVVLLGPSVPLTPLWFDWGVDMLAGTVVLDGQRLWQTVQEGGCREVWANGATTLQVRAERFARAAVR